MKRLRFYLSLQAIGLLVTGVSAIASADMVTSSTYSVTIDSVAISTPTPAAVVSSTDVVSLSSVTTPAVALTTPATPQTSSMTVRVLTLPDCIRLAVNGATTVLLAKNQSDFSGSQLLQAYTQFLPNLEANANYDYQSGRLYFTQSTPTSVRTTNHGGGYQLGSTLNVFAGGADFANWRSSHQRSQAADLSLVRAKQQISFDVEQAYLQELLDRRILQFNQTNFQASQQRERLLQAQSDAGSRSLADLYRQQAETSADQLAFINARSKAQDDMILLLRRLRIDLLTPYDLADVALDTPTANTFPDSYTLTQQALQQRADYVAAERTARAAQWDVTLARSGYYPRLDLVGTMEGTGDILKKQLVNGVNVVPASQPSLGHQWGDQIIYTGGLNLNWGLFDRFSTHLNVARARQEAANALIDSEDYHLEVEGDVQQSLNDFNGAVEGVSAADQGLKSAQESYNAVNVRYGVGASSIVDLLTAQSALLQAEAAQVQGRINYVLQKRAVELAAGTLQP